MNNKIFFYSEETGFQFEGLIDGDFVAQNVICSSCDYYEYNENKLKGIKNRQYIIKLTTLKRYFKTTLLPKYEYNTGLKKFRDHNDYINCFTRK